MMRNDRFMQMASPAFTAPLASTAYFARFGSKKLQHEGILKNISANGLVLGSDQAFRTGTEIRLQVEAESGGPLFEVKGRVRWSEYVPGQSPFQGHFEMAVEFVNVEEEERGRFRSLRKEMMGNRREPRFAKKFRVTVDGVDSEGEHYSVNLSRGGMFLADEHRLSVGAEYEFRILNVDIMQVIRAKGRVVDCVPRDRAEPMGTTPGIAVNFLELPEDDAGLHERYIERLEQFYNLENAAFLPETAG